MRGKQFQKPLEFSLQVDGESWRQGDAIQGTLSVRNHGGEAVPLSDVRVHLAYGSLKAVREKSEDAFDLLATSEMTEPATLAPGAEASHSWKFQMDPNCAITEKSRSPFLIYGRGAPAALGQLQLPIHPAALFEEVLKVIEVDFRFVRKSARSTAKGWVEVKMEPPTAKAFSAVEQLLLSFKIEKGDQDETIRAQYVFNVKKVEPGAAKSEVKKEKREVEQAFAKADYLLPSGRFNHAHIEAAVREALGIVEAKVIF